METKEEKQLKLDKRYIRMASIWAENSYCERRQVGALIVKDKMIISDGYNGTPAKKKKKTKKQQQQQEQLLAISIGFALILFAVFGFLKLGFLGILVANGFRIIAGNTYQLLCILLAILGFWVVVKNTDFKIGKSHRWFGGILFYLGILLFLHAHLFGKLHSGEPNILGTTWDKELYVHEYMPSSRLQSSHQHEPLNQNHQLNYLLDDDS